VTEGLTTTVFRVFPSVLFIVPFFTVFCFRCGFLHESPTPPGIPPSTLKQGELPLEGYTLIFQLVAQTTSYPDDALCAFYDASLNVS
ncbi:hypothetical protein M9458_017699, partial [Cirrhinus mrigala]